MLCSCCPHAVLMLRSCCAHAVLMLCSCCAHAVLMLRLCCAHAVEASSHINLPDSSSFPFFSFLLPFLSYLFCDGHIGIGASHRCLIKAQAAASVGLTGLSLDRRRRGSWTIRPSGKERGASASATCFAYAQLS